MLEPDPYQINQDSQPWKELNIKQKGRVPDQVLFQSFLPISKFK
jgi:hypothetical protein